MASETDHIALANKNHDVLMHLLRDVERFPEWVTVVAFYKAVQIAEAVLVKQQGRSCHGHQHRLDSLKRCGHKALHNHYRVLWSASSIARYLVDTTKGPSGQFSSFSDFATPEHVKASLVGKRLRGVECEAVKFLSDAGRTQLLRLPEASDNPPPTSAG
ncbi:MAG: hypothetical protein ABR915_23380 [Thermoguttaceae bacterium]|jgi:hypothetical protein